MYFFLIAALKDQRLHMLGSHLITCSVMLVSMKAVFLLPMILVLVAVTPILTNMWQPVMTSLSFDAVSKTFSDDL